MSLPVPAMPQSLFMSLEIKKHLCHWLQTLLLHCGHLHCLRVLGVTNIGFPERNSLLLEIACSIHAVLLQKSTVLL